MTIKLIVGLANPGLKYQGTRHNIGAWCIDLLLKPTGQSLRLSPKLFGYTSSINVASQLVKLLVPTTYMNASGKAVKSIMKLYKFSKNEILIIHDEMDLPLGIARFKSLGGSGGHNGLKSIISSLDNQTGFNRLRIGIGRPENERIVEFLLREPPIRERKIIDAVLEESVRCLYIWLEEGLVKATNTLHTFKVSAS